MQKQRFCNYKYYFNTIAFIIYNELASEMATGHKKSTMIIKFGFHKQPRLVNLADTGYNK